MPITIAIRATVLLSLAAAAGLAPPFASAGTETVLHAFQGGCDGAGLAVNRRVHPNK